MKTDFAEYNAPLHVLEQNQNSIVDDVDHVFDDISEEIEKIFAGSVDPDTYKSFEQIVIENGFNYETHAVTTEDGYILNVFRIASNETLEGAPVVFLQHGVTDSADCWIMNYNDTAPAFQLVRDGYDIWLGNQRGTKYSPDHTTLNPKRDKAYWEYSFTEMGQYDAPAQIDFVRNKTGAEKVTYIGHS